MARAVSLRMRLALLAAVGAMVVLSVGALMLYRDISTALSDAITDELTIRTDDLAADFDDGSISLSPAAVVAQVVDADGGVLSPAGADPVLSTEELDRASRGELIVDRSVNGIGEHARVLARPIADRFIGVVATSTAPLAQARQRLTVVLVVAGPLLAAAIGATAWLLTGAALRPVRRMTNEAATISMAEDRRRLPEPPGDDEIAELGRTLNAMLARIEATVAHERAFIDDAAHELRSPIAVLRGELELAAHDVGDPEAVANGLASALEEADRLTSLMEDLLTLARVEAGELPRADATTELLAATRYCVDRLPHRDGVRVEVTGEPVVVRGDPSWVEQIVTNLVANANRHATGRVLIATSTAGTNGRLSVADDGAGFAPELLPRAFERFARGDSARGRSGGGAGLGLAIVASLAEALGGTVTATNGDPLGGAHVEVELPAS